MIRVDDLPGGENAETFDGHAHGAQVSFFLSHNGPGTGPGLHTHPYEETFIVRGGRVRFQVGEDAVEVTAGHMVVVPAGTPHGFESLGPEPLDQISIHPVARMQTTWLT